MTTLTNLAPSQSYGDIITCNNNGQGLTNVLQQIQDGLGNVSPLMLSTIALNIDLTAGQIFSISDVPITATPQNINSMASENPVALGVGSLTVPVGDTAQRPGVPTNGMLRYNTDTNHLEAYVNGFWVNIG